MDGQTRINSVLKFSSNLSILTNVMSLTYQNELKLSHSSLMFGAQLGRGGHEF